MRGYGIVLVLWCNVMVNLIKLVNERKNVV